MLKQAAHTNGLASACLARISPVFQCQALLPHLLRTNRKLLAVTGLFTLAYALAWFVIYPLLA
ncbi:MAG: hypothetical protein KDI12_05575 [Anaerolineae bacterium]|nr:hypothetical protein [Anaerolineae bacterium]